MTTEETYEYKIETPETEELFEPEEQIAIAVTNDSPMLAHRYNINANTRIHYMKEAEALGYGVGCAVVKVSTEPYNRLDPETWGFVLDTVSWPCNNAGYFAPIKTGWLDGSTSYHYPEELIIVQFAPDDQDLGIVMNGGE